MSKLEKIYLSTNFKAYINKKKRFVLLLSFVFSTYYFSLPLLTSFLPRLMSLEILGGVNLAWIFALSQIIMTWLICHLYTHRAKTFDQTTQEIIENIED